MFRKMVFIMSLVVGVWTSANAGTFQGGMPLGQLGAIGQADFVGYTATRVTAGFGYVPSTGSIGNVIRSSFAWTAINGPAVVVAVSFSSGATSSTINDYIIWKDTAQPVRLFSKSTQPVDIIDNSTHTVQNSTKTFALVPEYFRTYNAITNSTTTVQSTARNTVIPFAVPVRFEKGVTIAWNSGEQAGDTNPDNMQLYNAITIWFYKLNQ